MSGQRTFYAILGISSLAGQDEITRAFRRRALETHPDKSPDPEAATRFREVVRAYETLSDITRRAAYDLRVLDHRSRTADYGVTIGQMLAAEYDSIMDSPADDVLEEYIVGNRPPIDTCLLTFFRDLENTQIFTLFRDGKAAFQQQRYEAAVRILGEAVQKNSDNILYHYYYGLALAEVRHTRKAIRELKIAIGIGEGRYPRRQCPGVRRALHDLYQGSRRLLRAWWMRHTQPELFEERLTVSEQERLRVKRMLYEDRMKQVLRQPERRALQAPEGER